MTFTSFRTLTVLFLPLLLCACPGGGASGSDPITVQIGETHHESGDPHAAGSTTASSVVGGDAQTSAHDHSEPHKHAPAANGKTVSIYKAYVVLDDIELVPCPSATAALRRFFGTVIGTAHAHGGDDHGGADPISGRDLSRANVIDLMTADEQLLGLGSMLAEPGEYCALRVSIHPASADAHGLPQSPGLGGKAFHLKLITAMPTTRVLLRISTALASLCLAASSSPLAIRGRFTWTRITARDMS